MYRGKEIRMIYENHNIEVNEGKRIKTQEWLW